MHNVFVFARTVSAVGRQTRANHRVPQRRVTRISVAVAGERIRRGGQLAEPAGDPVGHVATGAVRLGVGVAAAAARATVVRRVVGPVREDRPGEPVAREPVRGASQETAETVVRARQPVHRHEERRGRVRHPVQLAGVQGERDAQRGGGRSVRWDERGGGTEGAVGVRTRFDGSAVNRGRRRVIENQYSPKAGGGRARRQRCGGTTSWCAPRANAVVRS